MVALDLNCGSPLTLNKCFTIIHCCMFACPFLLFGHVLLLLGNQECVSDKQQNYETILWGLTQNIDLVTAHEGEGSVAGCGHGGEGQPLVFCRLIQPHWGLRGRVGSHPAQCIHLTIWEGQRERDCNYFELCFQVSHISLIKQINNKQIRKWQSSGK